MRIHHQTAMPDLFHLLNDIEKVNHASEGYHSQLGLLIPAIILSHHLI
jgi:hypothetical protein